MRKFLFLAIISLTLLCSTEVQAQTYYTENGQIYGEYENSDYYSDNIRCPWCKELMTQEEYAYHDCDHSVSTNDEFDTTDYSLNLGGTIGWWDIDGGSLGGVTVTGNRPKSSTNLWGYYYGSGSSGSSSGSSGSSSSNSGSSSSSSSGVYDDVEDNSQFKWTLEDILKHVMALNDSFRKIVEKLQKEGRIKQDSPDNNCHYYSEDHSLHVPADGNFSVENIIHEIIHYIQEENGMLNYDLCSADNEYQAYVLNYIINRAYGNIISAPSGTRDCQEWRDFVDLIPQGISVNDGECTYTEEFIDALQSLNHGALSQSFRYYWEWQKKENYYKNHDPNYKYNWEKMFNDLGVKKKE